MGDERRRGDGDFGTNGAPFKLETTDEMLTANAGLALFGEFIQGLGFTRWLAQEMPKPGSGRGYGADTYVTPLVLMLTEADGHSKTCAPSKATLLWAACCSGPHSPPLTRWVTGCAATQRVPVWPDCPALISGRSPPASGKRN